MKINQIMGAFARQTANAYVKLNEILFNDSAEQKEVKP